MGIFRDLLERLLPDDEKHAYNHSYIPPLAMIDIVPGLGFSLKWFLLVGLNTLRILVNVIAVTEDEDMNELAADLDELERDIQAEDNLDIVAGFLRATDQIIDDYKDAREMMIALKLAIMKFPIDEKEAAVHIITFQQHFTAFVHERMEARRATSLEDFNQLFRTLPLPKISENFLDDQTFADLRVQGPNPMVIVRQSEPLPHFPVTQEQFEEAVGPGADMLEYMQDGRVYLADYKLFDGTILGSFPRYQKYLSAPLAMFAVPDDQCHLVPVAIQCEQRPGPDNPVLTARSEGKLWEMAKTVVQIADGVHHEAISHLGQTHLLMEPFVVATMNQFDKDHPLSRLLMPHFEGTLFINNSAQGFLISSRGLVDKLLSPSIDMSRVAVVAGAQAHALDFNNNFLIDGFRRRGVYDLEGLPHYPYRDHAYIIFQAILAWTRDYVELTYASDDEVLADEQLQAWLKELSSQDGGRIRNIGEDGAIRTIDYLVEMLANVIFTASAKHAAVNFPQKDVMSYVPAQPLAGYRPAPLGGETPDEADWLALLPPLEIALSQINILSLLGGVYYTRLGQYPEDWFDSRYDNALIAFQKRLKIASDGLDKLDPCGDYPYLRPERIPQSINI